MYICSTIIVSMGSNFFNTESDRQLWIKLNAERQIEWEKGLTYFDKETNTYKPTFQALQPRTMEEALDCSKRQLEYDEKKCSKPRFTLEELLLLNRDGFLQIEKKNHQKWIEKFESY